jgi:hypothetical protein
VNTYIQCTVDVEVALVYQHGELGHDGEEPAGPAWRPHPHQVRTPCRLLKTVEYKVYAGV